MVYSEHSCILDIYLSITHLEVINDFKPLFGKEFRIVYIILTPEMCRSVLKTYHLLQNDSKTTIFAFKKSLEGFQNEVIDDFEPFFGKEFSIVCII